MFNRPVPRGNSQILHWLSTVTFIANEKTLARGARTHHLSICRQKRCTLCHAARVSQVLRYDNIELPCGSRGMQIVYS